MDTRREPRAEELLHDARLAHHERMAALIGANAVPPPLVRRRASMVRIQFGDGNGGGDGGGGGGPGGMGGGASAAVAVAVAQSQAARRRRERERRRSSSGDGGGSGSGSGSGEVGSDGDGAGGRHEPPHSPPPQDVVEAALILQRAETLRRIANGTKSSSALMASPHVLLDTRGAVAATHGSAGTGASLSAGTSANLGGRLTGAGDASGRLTGAGDASGRAGGGPGQHQHGPGPGSFVHREGGGGEGGEGGGGDGNGQRMYVTAPWPTRFVAPSPPEAALPQPQEEAPSGRFGFLRSTLSRASIDCGAAAAGSAAWAARRAGSFTGWAGGHAPSDAGGGCRPASLAAAPSSYRTMRRRSMCSTSMTVSMHDLTGAAQRPGGDADGGFGSGFGGDNGYGSRRSTCEGDGGEGDGAAAAGSRLTPHASLRSMQPPALQPCSSLRPTQPSPQSGAASAQHSPSARAVQAPRSARRLSLATAAAAGSEPASAASTPGAAAAARSDTSGAAGGQDAVALALLQRLGRVSAAAAAHPPPEQMWVAAAPAGRPGTVHEPAAVAAAGPAAAWRAAAPPAPQAPRPAARRPGLRRWLGGGATAEGDGGATATAADAASGGGGAAYDMPVASRRGARRSLDEHMLARMLRSEGLLPAAPVVDG